ncbi:sigma-54-dependent Fis family transcriptional regulator [Piscinibacter sakaiensis]|uniref:Transcriptional activator of acetoin dehydrogenase operon AcoR n=1 Tax=Piscinibacter sakaiensis TaxID=1547922 RepID=A0A0K8P0F4_PISS1|nr:sigma-54-dependent Fis family transcriptional regulator [Piscinibacter sakaiensis]GAP36132.1 transcriptional activator of acetoin dehydrogenase operon AcoR [Piscinibacter sakaiensis]
MHAEQRQHIDTVMQVASLGVDADGARRHERVIRDSWLRCVRQHRLDPTRMQEAVILPAGRLREHQDQMEAFTHIARHGLETLYQQVAGLGYVVLLTDARGVTVDFIGDLQLDASLRKAGLYLGADWSEAHAGTCGVGTAISTGEALTVHLDDHFDATHIPLTCTTSPVYDDQGRLRAVLDISALSSPRNKDSQALALQLVKLCARQIEDAAFLQRHRADWVLRLAAAPQFLDVRPQYLLALDAAGRVCGHNRAAQQAFGDAGGRLLGSGLEALFELRLDELGRFAASLPGDRRAVLRRGGKELLFLQATPPPARPAPPAPQAAALPEPLAALSAGDPALDRQLERAARLVNSPISLLVTGETGAGKEYFAKALHAASARRGRPFVAVNCAAIPEALVESELFGHVAGSFSGAAARGKKGLITEADGGTLFLDEIGDMPLALQARLLRVLSEREVLPVGATRPLPVNIRVIAATHAPLEDLVRQGRFRDDLYYRLNGAQITLPPLRERRDLGAMVERLAGGLAIAPAARAALLAHAWPGNLRELRNVLELAASLSDGRAIDVADLPPALLAPARPGPVPAAPAAAATTSPAAAAGPQAGEPGALAADDAALLAALKAAHWNVSAVARRLGLARMTIYRRMQRAGIVAPQHRD